MADNDDVKNAGGATISAATAELDDNARSPKVSLLDGSGSPTPISPATQGTLASLLATAGATNGAAVVTDANGTLQQYLRGIVKLLITAGTTVLGAGTALIGKVGIDQTTPGTTNAVALISGQNGVAGNSGTVGATTQRVTLATDVALPAGTNLIGNVGHGKTIKTVSGSLTSDTDVIAAVTSKRLKIIAYSLISTGVNANAAIFKSNGTGGTELWRLILQAPAASSVFGANLATSAPSFLFATAAGEKLTLDVGNSDTIHYSIAYFDDDAS